LARAKVVPEPLSFEEALAWWRDKVPMTPAQFAKLAREVKAKAFTVARVTKLDLVREVYNLIEKALAEGTTFAEFKSAAREVFDKKGWAGLAPYRLENVFRTNVQTAYAVGRYRQMIDPAVLEDRPFWMYDAVNDRRTRPSHMAMDGLVYPADHPFWDTWYPPNGYRCRCSVRSLSESQVRRRGLAVQAELPTVAGRPLLPDPGFQANPAKATWEPELSKCPKELRKAFEVETR
jgi:SPP1 gp7 family putative phage head morphogenesis protein